MQCRECDVKGRAVISIRWAANNGEQPATKGTNEPDWRAWSSFAHGSRPTPGLMVLNSCYVGFLALSEADRP
jgi:hypothetical protein